MKVRLLVAFLCVALPLVAFSQRKGVMPVAHTAIGVKGGLNLAGVRFTDEHLSSLPQQNAMRIVGGVFLDVPFSQSVGIAPELLYVERGMKTAYTHYSGSEAQYEIQSRYIDFRLPVLVGFSVASWFQPYVVAGVEAGYLLGGKILLQQEGMGNSDTTVAIGKANMNSITAGVFGGAGLRFFWPVNGRRAQLRVDATYHMGLVDSFSDMEHQDEAQPVNLNAYNINGERFPQGIEISVGLIIPLLPDPDDACYNFSKNKWR